MEHILNLEQVKKYYGGNSGNITKAVDGISMYVDKGEFVAIMGASGSGKTSSGKMTGKFRKVASHSAPEPAFGLFLNLPWASAPWNPGTPMVTILC